MCDISIEKIIEIIENGKWRLTKEEEEKLEEEYYEAIDEGDIFIINE